MLDRPGATLLERSERLLDALDRPRPLLALDNCEHLLAAAARSPTRCSGLPGLRLLATSREPLASPARASSRSRRSRADPRSSCSSIAPAPPRRTSRSTPAVAEICRRLDGLPLAIELAAARPRSCPSSRSPSGWRTASGCSPAAAAPPCRASDAARGGRVELRPARRDERVLLAGWPCSRRVPPRGVAAPRYRWRPTRSTGSPRSSSARW